jgi:hypothetical protein
LIRFNSSGGICVPSRTSSPKSGSNRPFIPMAQCSHPERWACKFVRVAGVALGTVLGAGTGLALEMALSVGFKTGVGAGLIWAPRGWQGSGR